MKHNFLALILALCVCTVLSGAVGYAMGQKSGGAVSPTVEETQPSEVGSALKISVVEDPEVGWTTLLSDNTSDSYVDVALHDGIAQANIEIGGETMPLGEALEKGLTTQEEIGYLARLDARNGFCQQTYATNNGLTHFTYQYPDFNLRVVYDVYVTPDGGADLINHIVIYPVRENEIFGPYVNFTDPATGQRTDLEDWGLTFDIQDVTPTGVTIQCKQTGGQQIGQLSIDWYYLFNTDGIELAGNADPQAPGCNVKLNMGGETTLTLDWTEPYGQLPSGNYRLTLNIIDHFDPEQVHPLMQDFHDWQVYDIEFSIP